MTGLWAPKAHLPSPITKTKNKKITKQHKLLKIVNAGHCRKVSVLYHSVHHNPPCTGLVGKVFKVVYPASKFLSKSDQAPMGRAGQTSSIHKGSTLQHTQGICCKCPGARHYRTPAPWSHVLRGLSCPGGTRGKPKPK